VQTPLVAGLGQDYVKNTLSTSKNPQTAIREVQNRGALHNPRCKPLLGLLDQLGCTRLALLPQLRGGG
jgi:hypothetical protein